VPKNTASGSKQWSNIWNINLYKMWGSHGTVYCNCVLPGCEPMQSYCEYEHSAWTWWPRRTCVIHWTGYRLDDQGFSSLNYQDRLGDPPSGYQGFFSRRGNRLWHELDHSPLSSSEGKKAWNYNSAPPACLHDSDRDKITFFNLIWWPIFWVKLRRIHLW